MSIIGESFEPWVENQIQIRQNLHGLELRNDSELTVLSNQNAWLKLGSSVSIDDNEKGIQRLKDIGFTNPSNFVGTKLAEKSVLFNSLSSLDINRDKDGNVTSTGNYNMRSGVINSNQTLWNEGSAYGLGGTTFGIVPPPGIISADIKAKNRGSIREANVQIKAQNKFQFEMLELLYLRLGYTMLLEWGWNKYYGTTSVPVKKGSSELKQVDVYKKTGSTLMEKYWFYNQKSPFTEVLGKIRKQRREYEGNYDGFLGKVTNFNWKFNPDGTYDINIKLITVGDVIESLKVNLPQTIVDVGTLEKNIQEASNENTIGLASANSAIITNAGDSNLSYALYSDIVDSNVGKWDGNTNGVKNNYLSLLGIVGNELKSAQELASRAGNVSTIKTNSEELDGANTIRYSYFLTFRELLLKIEKYVLPCINGEKILGIDLSDDQICAIYPYQVSLDPRVCFIKPFFLNKASYNNVSQFSSGVTAGGVRTVGVNNYWNFLRRINNFGTQDNKSIYGNIMNIYLNYDFITSLLSDATNDKGDIYLFKFLQKICDGINNALGGVNNIECVLNEDRIITFIEQNPIPGIETSTKYKDRFGKVEVPFELFGYNPATKNKAQTSNFVRDFGFDTKITPNIASMISIGATAEGTKTKNYDATAFSKWNEGLRDRFTLEYDEPETPPIVEASGSNEYSPLTIDQIQKISKKWDESEEDTHWGPFPRRKFEETNFGITKQGHKEIKGCPVTGKDFIDYTWIEYSNAVRNYIIKQELKNNQENQNTDPGYLVYLANAFGGKVNGTPIIDPYYFKFDPNFISMGKNSFKGYVNQISNAIYEKTGEPSNTIGFIPVDLNLKCDGISGIKIYNQLAIRQEFLPRAYPNALKFVITQVNHKIDNNDWTTELHTISTSNTKNTVLTDDLLTVVEYDLSQAELLAGGSTLSSGIQGDPEPLINPDRIGAASYSTSPLVRSSIRQGGINGRLEETAPQLLVVTDERGNASLKEYQGEDFWKLNTFAYTAYKKWREDAKAAGVTISITTGYRNLAYQTGLQSNPAAAPTGTSPHGWGGAIDLGISGLAYTGGTSAQNNLNDRLKEPWKIVATIGAKYGWYNPWRLADNRKTDEAWHFEYWGPA